MKITKICTFILLAAFLLILSACNNSGGKSSPTPLSGKTLVSIEVTPVNKLIHLGTKAQLTATGIYSDNTTENITNLVTWNSSNTSILAISNSKGSQGVAIAISAGSALIKASLNGIVSQQLQSSSITVSDATLTSIEITTNNQNNSPVIAQGTKQQLTATGIFADNTHQDITSSVVWDSSDTSTAKIDFNGVVTDISAGQTTIKATSGNINDTLNLIASEGTLVSIEITAKRSSIAKGTTVQFTATGIFSDNTHQDMSSSVTWTPSNTSIATIDNTGLATGIDTGTTIITATIGSISDTFSLSVTPVTLTSIEITSNNLSMAKGTTKQFTATGIFSDNTHQNLTTLVLWSSSDLSVASLSNATGTQGIATGVGIGNTTITAIYNGVSSTANLAVTAATLTSIAVTAENNNLSIVSGYTKQFTATGIYSDNSTQNITSLVTWASSNTTVAKISNASGSRGLATGVRPSTTKITAIYNGVTSNVNPTLTVTSAVLTSIQVTANNNSSIAIGYTKQLTATAIYSDGSTQNITSLVTWASSDTSVAKISNAGGSQGLATAIAEGTTTISATYNGVTSNGLDLVASPATLSSISISAKESSIVDGNKTQFTAIGTYSDNTTQDITSRVTWASSDLSVATISNADGTRGLATGLTEGNTTITAIYNGVTSNGLGLSVSVATLNSISISAKESSIVDGNTTQFTAIGTYSDNTTQDITSRVTWVSSNISVATISNTTNNRGLASGMATGNTTITAIYSGVTSNGLDLAVSPATLQSISISAPESTIADGNTTQFTAIGTYSDNSTQNITTSVNWTSSNISVATISNANGNNGTATAVAASGTTDITATSNGVTSNSITLTVTAPVLSSIQVAVNGSNSVFVSTGNTVQLIATAVYSNGSNVPITTSATWSSSQPSTVTINNQGSANAISQGSATVQATYNGMTANANFTVLPVYAYIANGQGSPLGPTPVITKCLVNYDGNISGCMDAGIKSMSIPANIAFNNSKTILYFTDNYGPAISPKACLISANGELGCSNLDINNSYYYTRGIAINKFNTYMYLANFRFYPILRCSVTSTGNSTACSQMNSLGVFGGYVTSIVLNPAGTYAYITNDQSVTVSAIDPVTGNLGEGFDSGLPILGTFTPYNLTFNSAGTNVYITDDQNARVIRCLVNPTTAKFSSCHTSSIPGNTRGIFLNTQETYLYVTTPLINTVWKCTINSEPIDNFLSCSDSGATAISNAVAIGFSS